MLLRDWHNLRWARLTLILLLPLLLYRVIARQLFQQYGWNLSEIAEQTPITPNRDDPDACVSPDGRWLLTQGELQFTVRSRDGRIRTSRHVSKGEFWTSCSKPLWLPDSKRWVCLMAGQHSIYAVVFSREQPGIIKRIALGYPRGTDSGFDLVDSDLIGVITSNRVLAKPHMTDWHNQEGFQQEGFFTFNLEGAPAKVRDLTIPLPVRGQWHTEVVLSPHSSRLAWLLRKAVVSNLGTFTVAEPYQFQLWVSYWDGSDMHIIGSLSGKIPRANYYYWGLHDISWLADEKHVRLYRGKQQWTIPLQ